MTNESISPNSYLKCFHSDTYLCAGNSGIVGFNDVDINGVPNCIAPLYNKADSAFANPFGIPIPMFTKRINLRVFNPDNLVPISAKFVAFYNLVTIPGHVTQPQMMMLDGTEVEIYGLSEIKKIRLFDNQQPFLLQIAMFK